MDPAAIIIGLKAEVEISSFSLHDLYFASIPRSLFPDCPSTPHLKMYVT
jgi:hypothetical protein